MEGWCEIDLKVQFFFSILLPILRIRGEIWSSEKCKGVCSNVLGQIGEIAPLSPEKVDIFLIFRNFMFLGQGSYEITGGRLDRPLVIWTVTGPYLVEFHHHSRKLQDFLDKNCYVTPIRTFNVNRLK